MDEYSPVDALTLDGRVTGIRSVRTSDTSALITLHDSADTRSLKFRFSHSLRTVSSPSAKRLTRPAADDFAALVALGHDRVVAVASYERGHRGCGEFAVFVAARHHGRGIATLLLEHLCMLAYREGLTRLAGKVLVSNQSILRVVMGLSVGGLAPAIGTVSRMRGELCSRILGSTGFAMIHASKCPLAIIHNAKPHP